MKIIVHSNITAICSQSTIAIIGSHNGLVLKGDKLLYKRMTVKFDDAYMRPLAFQQIKIYYIRQIPISTY